MATTSLGSDSLPPPSVTMSPLANATPPPFTSPQSAREAPSLRPTASPTPLSTASHTPNQSRWSSLLTIFQPEILIPLVIGTVIGALGTKLSQAGNEMNKQALELAKWTAEKDYRDQCEQDQIAGSLSEDCEKFIHRTLQPPPHVSKRCYSCIPSEGMTEADLNILNRSFAPRRTTEQMVITPAAGGLEAKFCIIFVLSAFGLALLYFVGRKRQRIYQWIPRANTALKNSSLPRFRVREVGLQATQLYREISEIDPRSLTLWTTSTRNNPYIRYTSPQDGLRRRKAGKPAQSFQNLHDAALHGDLATVRMLLSQGADVNAKGGRYENALQAAAFNGHEKVAAILLHSGADFKAKGGIFGDALQAAAFNGHEKVVEMLLNHGADFHALGGHYGSAFHAAASEGHEKVVEMMLKRGASPRIVNGKRGVLLAAAGRGHEKVVEMLLDRDADAKAKCVYYGSALDEAVIGGHEKVVKMLLDRGADVNAGGGGALYAAASEGYGEIVEMLLDRGAGLNAEDMGALGIAASEGHEKVVEILLDRGADVHAENERALRLAASKGHEKVIEMLLDHGADVNADGGRALQVAAREGHEKVVEILLNRRAGVGTGDENALQEAASRGHEKVVEMLLNRGTNANAEGAFYRTALQAAWEHKHMKIVKMLQGHSTNWPQRRKLA